MQLKHQAALDDLSIAVELNPENAEALYLKGTINLDLEHYKDAVVDFTKVIIKNNENSKAYCQRGQCYYFLRKYNEALLDLDSAININPDNTEAYYFRGATLKQLGKEDDAIDNINMAIKLDPQIKSVPEISELLKSKPDVNINELTPAQLTSKIINLENEVKRLGRLYSGIFARVGGNS